MVPKKTGKLTRKQQKLVEGIIAGKSGAQAARDAGYSPNNARQRVYQALQQIGERARDAMDQAGFTLEHLIDKDLRSLLEGRETKFFPWRKTTKLKTEQIVETRESQRSRSVAGRSILPLGFAAIMRRRSSTSIPMRACRSA